jgi:hypothetical protein
MQPELKSPSVLVPKYTIVDGPYPILNAPNANTFRIIVQGACTRQDVAVLERGAMPGDTWPELYGSIVPPTQLPLPVSSTRLKSVITLDGWDALRTVLP